MKTALSCIFILMFSFSAGTAHALEENEDILDFAQKKRIELQQDVIDVDDFMELSFVEKNKYAVIGGVTIVGSTLATVATAGLAAPVVGAGSAALLGSAAASSSSDKAKDALKNKPLGSDILLTDDGNVKLSSSMRTKVLNYYDENYRTWIHEASSSKEFAEIAWKNIASFLEHNSRH